MRFLRYSLLGLLITLAVARLLGYFAYAAACLPSPLETFHLEAKMVLLAFRAEMGESLYPDWRTYPHVANFFGPLYFNLVGKIGAAFGKDPPGLFSIGRGVAFGSGLLTSLAVGLFVGHRYGRIAGMAGAVASLGAAPMFGFSVMARPDMTAETLGVVGFILSGNRRLAWRVVGAGLMVLAIFTKQTTGVFLLAASLAWVFEGEWRRGLRLIVGGVALSAAVVMAITLLIEPNFARSLAGESSTPWDASSLVKNLLRAGQLSPDILFFPVLGLVLWASGATGRNEVRPAVLTSILLAASIGLAAKRGADLNYYLSLRVCEGLAIGSLLRAWSLARSRAGTAGLAAATLLGCAMMVPGLLFGASQALGERNKAAFLASPYGQEIRGFYRDAFAMARNPQSRLLTDSGLIDLYQGSRAVFGDPYLFRMLAETGQLDLTVLRDRVDAQYYDLIITTSELDRPSYDTYAFGLPMPVVERAREHYVRIGSRAGLFLYSRREGSVAPSPVPAGIRDEKGRFGG